MVRVVGVRFRKAGKIYYFDPADHPVSVGCKVIVETARGLEYGDVAVGPKYVNDDEVVQPLKPVIRVASEADAAQAQLNKAREREAFGVALQKIDAHGLEMNLVDVEYTFDGSKIIFSFTAEGRIDFRELVRDLAGVFRTRIEMRQIGVRDEAKLIGGIGPCGRILCCTSFLGEFAPVSIRMAKDQNLSLNPTKISGLCGRLMCCLRYEQDTYEAAKKDPTLAPGYVPPVLPSVDEPDEEPVPAAAWFKAPSILSTDEDAEIGGRLGRAVAERNESAERQAPTDPVTAPASRGQIAPAARTTPAAGAEEPQSTPEERQRSGRSRRERQRREKGGQSQGQQRPAGEVRPVPAPAAPEGDQTARPPEAARTTQRGEPTGEPGAAGGNKGRQGRRRRGGKSGSRKPPGEAEARAETSAALETGSGRPRPERPDRPRRQGEGTPAGQASGGPGAGGSGPARREHQGEGRDRNPRSGQKGQGGRPQPQHRSNQSNPSNQRSQPNPTNQRNQSGQSNQAAAPGEGKPPDATGGTARSGGRNRRRRPRRGGRGSNPQAGPPGTEGGARDTQE